MKNTVKKLVSMLLALCVAMTAAVTMPGTAQKVEAANAPYFLTHNPVAASPDNTKDTAVLSIMYCDKKSEIKKLKSSNTKVATVEAKDGYVRATYGKHAGTTVISCTVRGKKISTKFVVKKYQNPLTSFKVGKNQYKGKLNRTTSYDAHNVKARKKQTITWKARKGWKIKYYYVSCEPQYKSEMFRDGDLRSSVTLKNITFRDTDSLISVICYNQKTKVTDEVRVWLYAY